MWTLPESQRRLQNHRTTPTMKHISLVLTIACLLTTKSHALSSPLSLSRRAFVRDALLLSGVGALQDPAHAYGEFEPGAKARRKAAASSKQPAGSTTTKKVVEAASSMDLKGALGEYSSTSSKSDPRQTKK